MSRIICITGNFKIYDEYGIPTGETEFLVSHGVNEDTMENIVLPQEHPDWLGTKFDMDIGNWVITNE